MSLVTLEDAAFESHVLRCDHPVVVLYALDNEADLTVARILERVADTRGETVSCFRVVIAGRPECAQRYGISSAPILVFFAGGNPVARLLGVQPREEIERTIDEVLARPVAELPVLDSAGINPPARSDDRWGQAVTSGLMAGAVFAFALHSLHGAFVVMVPAAAIGMFIVNSNFRFSFGQKMVAILIMLGVGLFGPNLLRAAFGPGPQPKP